MLIMLCSAFIAAVLKGSPGDMLLSAVVTYTVFSAWLTARHKKNETGTLEYIATIWIVVIAIAAFYLNSQSVGGGMFNPYSFWGVFAVCCAIGDIRNLQKTGLPGVQRVLRHVWRMGFSLLWAVLALTDKIVKIQGANVKELPAAEVLYIIATPTIFILMLVLYWVFDILIFSHKKFATYGE